MSQRSNPGVARRPIVPARAPDQVDALVGLLLEQARIMHTLWGYDPRTFDYDAARDDFYATAAAPAGTSSKADRYRALARRGIGSSQSTAVDGPVDEGPPCESDG